MSEVKEYIFINPVYAKGAVRFPSKKALVEAIRKVVYYGATTDEKGRNFRPDSRRISKASNCFLMDAYMRLCPERMKRKSAGQSVYFESVGLLGKHNEDGTALRGLRLVREDGTYESITIRYTEISDGTNWKKELNATLRHIVNFYIQQEKERQSKWVRFCMYSGEEITPETETHMDHMEPTFHEIVDKWISEKSITPGPELFEPKSSATHFRVLSSEELANDFIKYHAWESRLMLVSAKANLDKGSKKIAA